MMISDFRIPRPLFPAVRQMARVTLPDDADRPELMEPILEHFEMSLRCLPVAARNGLMAGLAAFELGAVARYGRRFSRLDRPRALQYFDWYWSSPVMPLHYLVFGFKAYLSLAYYEQPIVRERIHYQPDAWIAETAKRRLEKWRADIEAHEHDLVQPNPLIAPKKLVRKVKHA